MNHRNPALLTFATLAAASLSGCMGENRVAADRPQAVRSADIGMSRARPQVDEGRIKQFGFEVYWDSYIRDETITSVSMEGDQLYCFTESKRLYQVDVHSGMVNWVYDVGRKLDFTDGGRPIAEWVYTPDENNLKQYDEIFFCAEDHLYAVDKRNGSGLWTVYLGFTPSSPPEASPTHVFVGSWDDRVYAVRKDRPEVVDWSWRTGDDIVARPVYNKPNIFVPSRSGTMHVFEAVTGKIRWPFPTEKPITQDPVVFKSLMYLPSDDFNLYVLGVEDGLIHYRYCAGEPYTDQPTAIGKMIYTPTESGMHALLRKGRPQPSEGNPRKTDHELAWMRKGATKVLCRGMGDVYLRERGESRDSFVISRIDAEKGNFRDSLDLTGVNYTVTNALDPTDLDKDRALRAGIIFLGFRNGWIVALKERATIPGA